MDEYSIIVILEGRPAFLILQQHFEWQLHWIRHIVCPLVLIKCLALNWNIGRAAILYQWLLEDRELQ